MHFSFFGERQNEKKRSRGVLKRQRTNGFRARRFGDHGEDSLGAMKADYLAEGRREVRKQNYRDAILHYTEALE